MNKTVKKAIIILVIILAVVVAASLGLSALNKPLNRNDQTYKNVTIEQGSSTGDIAAILKKNGLINSEGSYKFLSKIWRYDGKYKAGMYSLSPSMTKSEIADIIKSGKSQGLTVTIPEGYTVDQIAKLLADQGLVDKDKFLDACANGDFSKFSFVPSDKKGDPNRLEGFLFPETYQLPVNADAEQIIVMMLSQFQTVYSDKYQKKAESMGLTTEQVITIASLIEKEAAADQDRAKVASVIYNRLDKDMALQFCSSVQYLLDKQGIHKEILSEADTQIDSPYNTYINQGLPPAPICSPGKASIRAALWPDKTDYLYFVVSPKLDGTNEFTSDYDEFQKISSEYAKAVEKRDSKK